MYKAARNKIHLQIQDGRPLKIDTAFSSQYQLYRKWFKKVTVMRVFIKYSCLLSGNIAWLSFVRLWRVKNVRMNLLLSLARISQNHAVKNMYINYLSYHILTYAFSKYGKMISVQSHIEHNPPLNLEDFWALYAWKGCWRTLCLKTKRLLKRIPCPWNTIQQSLP